MELLERDRQLSELIDSLSPVRSGSGVVISVAGEAGIGKSALIARLSDAMHDIRVLETQCDPLFTPRALGPIFDLAEECGELGELLAPGVRRERVFPAIAAFLARVPTMLVMEDIHWADHATLDLLKHLARRIARMPVALVLTSRDDARHDSLVTLTAAAGRALKRIVLAPLSREAVATLAERSSHEGDANTVFNVTGGNPFYVHEVLAAPSGTVPPTVRDAVLSRTTTLSAAALAILEVACVNPGRAEQWLIESLTGADPSSLDEALSVGLLRVDGSAFAFRHELARRAIEDSLTPLQRRSLHRRVLAALRERDDVPLARLAHHAKEAHDPAAILELAPRAAQEAIRASAHREAASHYRDAVAHADALGERERAQLYEQLAYECYLTEQESDALVAMHAAWAIWSRDGDRLREGDALRWLSRLSWFLGRNEDAVRYAHEAIAILEQLPPGRELAMAWSNRSQLHMLADERDAAVTWGNRAIELARQLDEPSIVAHAMNNVGASLANAGDPDGRATLQESLAIALAHDQQEHAARAYCNLATQAVSAVDYASAEQFFSEGLAYCSARDLDAWRIYVLAWRARMRFERGDWSGATDDAEVVLTHPGVATISRIPALTVLGRVRSRRGDPGGATVLAEAHALAMETAEAQRIVPVACARAESGWLAGDRASIEAAAAPAYALTAGTTNPWARGELAWWLSEAGSFRAPSDMNGVAEPWRLQLSGALEEAAAAWSRLGRPYDEARALVASGDTRLLHRAEAILTKLGDHTLLARARQRLGRRGPHVSTRTNPAGLTAREIEVLRLVEQGLRNAEIGDRLCIAAKTVDHHVSAVLAKLGARTRGEAASLFRASTENGTREK